MTETKSREEEEDDKEDEDNDSNDSSSDSDSNDESSDSSDSEGDQNDEPPSPEDKEDDIDRRHPDDEDSDDDCIPTLPTNLLQELENNEMFGDAIATVQQPTPPSTPPQDATPAPKTSVTEPPIQELPKDSIQIDNIQRRQKHLRDFMNQSQSGEITPTHCPECLERLTQGLGPSHVAHHVRDLSIELDTLRPNKDKRDNKRKVQPKIESPKKKRKRFPRKSLKKSPKEEDNKPRVEKKDEVRKKMWKRIYGRKKYQLRNTGREVTVSEEEVDAEIKKDALRNSGSGPGLSWSLLRDFVDYKSAEYKHEQKKARDRLQKRILRKLKKEGSEDRSRARNIPIADIEAEMLVQYMRDNPNGPPRTRNLANAQENNQANEKMMEEEAETGTDLKMEIDPAIMDLLTQDEQANEPVADVVEAERSNMEIEPFFSGDINMELKAERSVQESVKEDILDLDLTELIPGAEIMIGADMDDIVNHPPPPKSPVQCPEDEIYNTQMEEAVPLFDPNGLSWLEQHGLVLPTLQPRPRGGH